MNSHGKGKTCITCMIHHILNHHKLVAIIVQHEICIPVCYSRLSCLQGLLGSSMYTRVLFKAIMSTGSAGIQYVYPCVIQGYHVYRVCWDPVCIPVCYSRLSCLQGLLASSMYTRVLFKAIMSTGSAGIQYVYPCVIRGYHVYRVCWDPVCIPVCYSRLSCLQGLLGSSMYTRVLFKAIMSTGSTGIQYVYPCVIQGYHVYRVYWDPVCILVCYSRLSCLQGLLGSSDIGEKVTTQPDPDGIKFGNKQCRGHE